MELTLKLDLKSNAVLYKALAQALKEAINNRSLLPGQELPSVRDIASTYGLSTATVLRAYEYLCEQGYIETVAKSHARVKAQLASGNDTAKPQESVSVPLDRTRLPSLSQYGERLLQVQSNPPPHGSASLYIPDLAELPVSLWQKMLVKHRGQYHNISYFSDYGGDRFGYMPLREAISAYLRRARGILCKPEQVVVTCGSRLDLMCRILLNQHDTVAVEDPTYAAARAIFHSHGASLAPIPVDEAGMKVDLLMTLNPPPKLVYVAPSHQDPTGVVLTLPRRQSLVRWAQKHDVIVWENDFDSPYRYTSQPLPALSSIDDNDVVIYSGSFWVSLGPLVSLGYLVLPSRFLEVMKRALTLIHLDLNPLEQCALADFIQEGHLEQAIRSMRKNYASRRQSLIHALSLAFGNKVQFLKESSGMHLLVRFSKDFTENAVLAGASAAGLHLVSTRDYYLTKAVEREFIIPFSAVRKQTVMEIIHAFAKALDTNA